MVLKSMKKIFEIGNLVREEIINLNIFSEGTEDYEKIKVLVLGGKSGCKNFC